MVNIYARKVTGKPFETAVLGAQPEAKWEHIAEVNIFQYRQEKGRLAILKPTSRFYCQSGF